MSDPGPASPTGRGTGYCLTDGCEDYGRGFFVLGPSLSPTYCRACKQANLIVEDTYTVTGDGPPYREVRVNFLYDPLRRVYRNLAIVRLEGVSGAVYELFTTLISTEKRALKAAETILGALNLTGKARASISETVFHCDWSRADWSAAVAEFGRRLASSALAATPGGPVPDPLLPEPYPRPEPRTGGGPTQES